MGVREGGFDHHARAHGKAYEKPESSPPVRSIHGASIDQINDYSHRSEQGLFAGS